MDGGNGAAWRQVGATFLLMGPAGMITSAYGVVAVPLAAEFQPTRMVLMLAITMVTMVCAVLSPVLGPVMDRVSLRRLLMLGSLLAVAGFTALSFAGSFIQVLAIYALLMAPATIILGPMSATVLLSRWFVARRGAALGIAMMGLSAGSLIYPPVIQALLDSFDWRTAMQVLAVILCVIGIPAAALVINHPPALKPEHGVAASAEADRPEITTRTLLTDSTFWLIVAVFAVVISGMTGTVTNVVPLARDVGVDGAAAALLLSILSGGGLLSKFLFVGLADRINLRYLLFFAVGGFTAGMACLIRADSGYALMVSAAALLGLCGGFMMPLQSFLLSRIYGARIVGRVIGLLQSFVLVFSLTAPPLFGLTFDIAGSYAPIFTIFAALGVATLLLLPFIRLYPKEQELTTRAAVLQPVP